MAAGRFPRFARWGLHVAVALGLLALVFWQARVWELDDRYDIAPAFVVGAVLLNLPMLPLFALRGRLVLGRLGHRVSLVALLPVSVLGNVAGALTPGSMGDLLRTPFLRQRHDIPYADGLAAVLYERGFSLWILALSTGVATAWAATPTAAAAAVTAGGVALALAGPAAGARLLERLRGVLPADESDEPASFFARAGRSLGRSLDSLLLLLRDATATAAVSLLSLAIFALMALQTWFVVRALGLDVSLAEAGTALGASSLAGIATFLPLGLGTLDATLAALVGAAEGGFETGAAAAVLVRATVTLPLGIAAFASYLFLVAERRAEPRDGLDADGSGGDRIVQD